MNGAHDAFKLLAALAAAGAMASPAFSQAADAPAAPAASEGMISLAEVAPELYFALRRYPKFYGDPNTKGGGLGERTQLSGDWGGLRDQAVDHGIYIDVSLTQFLQGNLSGGVNQNQGRYNGTVDYWVTIDSGKAGLWPGGAIFIHAESSWQAKISDNINGDTGSLLPANYDANMPTRDENEGFVIPELYLAQGLPGNMMLLAGKLNFAGVGDQSVFANNERTQFEYTGLVNNPILGSFIPYTPLGLGVSWVPSKEHNLAVLATQTIGDATTSGFDNFNGTYSAGVQYQYSTLIANRLPGNYRVLGAYSNKELTNYDVNRQQLIAEIIGLVPVSKKTENYAALLNFDQYLWTRDPASSGTTGRGQPPVGVGIFFRAGWEPQDRNVIDQFYSFGFGGYGGLPGRDRDQWGVGWAATHISQDLRKDLDILGKHADEFEQAFEAFYNIAVTPAVHATLNVAAINSVSPSVDTAVAIGARLQVDF